MDSSGRNESGSQMAFHKFFEICQRVDYRRTPPGSGSQGAEDIQKHLERILFRGRSWHTNARLEGLNGLFQAARARARGYRNVVNFITMIYLIAAPIGDFCAK